MNGLSALSGIFLFSSSVSYAAAILNIVPASTSKITLTKTGSTSLTYTVTNTTNKTVVNNITIEPGYNTPNDFLSFSVQNNTCNGALNPGSSCTFTASIQAATLTGTAILMPRVCIFNGADCSVPVASNRVAVVVPSNDCGRFTSGATGTWNTVASSPLHSTGMEFSNYLPASAPATLYLGRSSTFYSFISSGIGGVTGSYNLLAAPTVSFESYGSMVYYAGSIWTITSGNVLKYNTIANTWQVITSGLNQNSDAQTALDDLGNLWTVDTDGNLLKYNIALGTVTTITLTNPDSTSEPRIVYDSCSGFIYFAGYNNTIFYSYDPISGTETSLQHLPGGLSFQDGFCADRSGHIFAVTNSAVAYQYTISTGLWTPLPAGGVVGSFNSTCGVGADGYLYATDPRHSSTIFSLKLQ